MKTEKDTYLGENLFHLLLFLHEINRVRRVVEQAYSRRGGRTGAWKKHEET